MKFQFPEGKRLISLAYKIDKKYMQHEPAMALIIV
jgi:hypothetical protein